MTFLGVVGIFLGYLVYRDNKKEINEYFKTQMSRKEGKRMMRNNEFGYYAGNENEKKFDDQIRSAVKESGDKAQMAMYVQQQEILNQLRKLRDGGITLDNKKHVEPYGYPVADGYMGRMPDGHYILFATEGDYREHLEAHVA